MKKKPTPEPKTTIAEQEQTEREAASQKAAADRVAAEAKARQQALANKQATERNAAITLLDNVVARVSTDREGHIKLGAAIQLLRASNAKLELLELGAAQ